MVEEMKFITSLGVTVKPVFLSPVPGTPIFSEYAKSYPQLLTDPYWHNDSFFIIQLPLWGEEKVEMVRQYARELNTTLR